MGEGDVWGVGMNTVWKYPLNLVDSQTIEIPFEYKILTVQVQNGVPCLWALVDSDMYTIAIRVAIFGTGHPANTDGMEYIGTFQTDYGFVGHVFGENV